ncbi:hypothetical protein OH77DRAFT_1393593 [Trametes cingulata]|nr:hypothetical protein OH77DRAFT_1393593 [Trametes cingulata]
MASINNESPANSPAPSNNDGYPEQKHAGAVGYGPEYGKGASTGDKLTGIKEEMKGKILRKPDVVEHGREMRTGELKKKQQEQDPNPPMSYPPAMSDTTHPTDKGAREQAASTAPEGTEKAARQQSMGNTDKTSYIG